MRKAIDVANFFIDLTKQTEDHDITNLKLNKLIYYAQGWALVKLGRPLFDEPIEAWSYGPVVREVYKTFQPCCRDIIQDVSGEYPEEKFSREEILTMVDVAREYGQYSAGKLVNMTHIQGGPWDEAFTNGENTIISQKALKDYFEGVTLPEFSISLKDGCIDTRNENGVLELPEDWYNPEDDIYDEM